MESLEASTTTRRYSAKLTRDQKIQVLTLYRVGQSKREISKSLGITLNQVKYTIRSGRFSPGKSSGRPPKITPEQEDELERFIRSSQEARQMSYLELAMNFSQWNVGQDAIRNALKRRGYSRRMTRHNPPLS